MARSPCPSERSPGLGRCWARVAAFARDSHPPRGQSVLVERGPLKGTEGVVVRMEGGLSPGGLGLSAATVYLGGDRSPIRSGRYPRRYLSIPPVSGRA